MAIKQSRNIHLEVYTFPHTSFKYLEFTGQKGAYYHSFSHGLTLSDLKKGKKTSPAAAAPRRALRAQLHRGSIYTGNPPKGATSPPGSRVLVTFLIRNEKGSCVAEYARAL